MYQVKILTKNTPLGMFASVYACQINHLARQIFIGKEQQRIINAYKRISRMNYGFMILSFAQEIPDELAVITDFWEICPSVFL